MTATMSATTKRTSKMNPTRRKARWLILAAGVILVIVLLRFAPVSKMESAQRIVREIRTYQTAHNRLPDSLADIREKDGPIHYQKLDDRSFKVSFQANPNQTEVYDSVTDTWFRQP
jgi:hypothetical protein